MRVLVALCVLASLAAAASHTRSAFGWVTNKGELTNQGGDFALNVTYIGTGHYCVKEIAGGNSFNYAAITVTLQTSNGLSQGSAAANTGWGDLCNPYGYAIYTYDSNGNAADRFFSFIVTYAN